ncbi:MAG TPA: FAD-dependent monooxygenase [Candidatus Peribacteraceae bacterium]|nr:FAD-dependent monooxygenase [Candidatus Peribacteraceae bacterium]
MQEKTTVLIAGAGPTGLMMACQLALHGIPFRIIDKSSDHTTQSRAVVVQARSLEIFEQMGIADRAVKEGEIAQGARMYFNGSGVARIELQDIGRGLTRFPFALMLEQSKTEALLVDFLKQHGHEVERQTELLSFMQNEDGVEAVIRLPTRKEETVRAAYLVSAEGAHSVVRHQLQIPFGGKTYQQSLFVLDCKVDVDLPENELYLMLSREGLGGLFPLTHKRYRVLGTIPEGMKDDELTFDVVQKTFAKRTHMKMTLHDPEWIAVYHAHHRYASRFRIGRCFLIGDSAHIHSPVGGQGMNTGLQDAYNLAWKLALVAEGKAQDDLLDTFNDERIEVARALVHTTDTVFHFITNEDALTREFRLWIFPVLLRMVLKTVERVGFLRRWVFRVVSETGIRYAKSPLSHDASFGDFPTLSVEPGDRVPFVPYLDERGNRKNIQDLLAGTLFHLWVFTGASSSEIPHDMQKTLERYPDLVQVDVIPRLPGTEEVYEAFGIKDCGWVLIRPDMYAAARSSSMDVTMLTSYLSRFLTQT